MSTINLTDAIEATARAEYERATGARPGSLPWRSCPEQERITYRTAVRPHVEAAAPFIAARALQDAAAAFGTTRPTEAARHSLDYPVVELQAMAYRHTVAQNHIIAAPVRTAVPAADQSTETSARHRIRTALSAFVTTKTANAA